MKIFLICLLVIASCSSKKPESTAVYETPTDFNLVELNPIKIQNSKALGTIEAELLSVSGTIIKKQSSLGDCKQCVRGFSVKEFIGIRLEGKDLKTLKIARKHNPQVKIVDCSQNELIDGNYDCKFSIDNKLYNLKLSVK